MEYLCNALGAWAFGIREKDWNARVETWTKGMKWIPLTEKDSLAFKAVDETICLSRTDVKLKLSTMMECYGSYGH